MATIMAPFAQAETQREVLRCDHCKLVQFRTPSHVCRRCRRSMVVEKPAAAPAPVAFMPAPAEAEGIQVATAVRDLRHVRNLSQRQLAARMGVPRSMPTLSSLDRLAKALEVDISALLRDASTRHSNETAMLMADPFLAEIASYTSQLDALQRTIFLNHVRELAAGRRRTA